MAAVKEKGAPRDQDKLIRQLSLVTYLMARQGRPVSAETIRQSVEGYDDGTRSQEAVARRFFADRDELRQLGIEIESRPNEDGEGDSYLLPPENFFLPPVPFSPEELASLHTCLHILDGQFAYSNLLRLALQGLALGSGNTLEDPATSCVAMHMPSAGFDADVAKRQARMDEAIAKRKTIRFDYHSFSSDTVEERLVDPYSMIYTHGDWYLVGFSHERGALRLFKLRRIRGRIRYLNKSDHNFAVPDDFQAEEWRDLQPWQLGPRQGVAEIRFSPRYSWWAGNNFGHCGELVPEKDGSMVFRTGYSSASQICSLVLNHSEETTLEGPPELRESMAGVLDRIAGSHDGEAPVPAPAIDPQPERGGAGIDSSGTQTQVEPDRFAHLATTVTYLVDRLGGEMEARLPVDEVCQDLGFNKDELEQAMNLLQLVNTGAGGYLISGSVDGDFLNISYWPEGDILKKPVRLTPREARAMLLAIDLVGGQILAGQNQSLETAREKITQAAGGLDDLDTIPVGETEREDADICRAINRGLAEQRLVEIEYLTRASGKMDARVVEPYLVNNTKGQWYLVAWCRMRDDIRTFRFEMIKSARLLEDSFETRDIDLVPYRKDPRQPSGKQAPRRAGVLFSPRVARWVYEKQPDAIMLEDGSLLGEIPWFDNAWLVDEILQYCGEAVLIAPEDMREQLRDAAIRLAARYR
ncbi:MAG: WYL domain-containing protein [Thermoleophilia bacterium]